MKMRTRYRYLHPAQPMRVWAGADLLTEVEGNPDWVAEYKKNGVKILLVRNPNGTYEAWNRHGARAKLDLNSDIPEYDTTYIKELNKLNWEGLCCIYLEHLDRRTTDVKKRMWLFDVQVWNNEVLTKCTFKERLKFLHFLTLPIGTRFDWFDVGHVKGGVIQQSICFNMKKHKVMDLYNQAVATHMTEGLVFKKLSGLLEVGANDNFKSSFDFKLKKVEDHFKSAHIDKYRR